MPALSQLQKLWVEKYRPPSIEGYIFHNSTHKIKFLKMLAEGSIPNLLLSGVQGTGKTTIARILISEMDVDQSMDVLTINASDLNSVDVMRVNIKEHIQSFAMGGFKIINLEEADYLTPNAQAVLRVLMEDYADSARFILTCNYQHKILPAVRSRCQEFEFKAPDKSAINTRVKEILEAECVTEYDPKLLDKYIRLGYPDIRKVIQLLQENVVDGVLMDPSTEVTGDYKFLMLDLLSTNNWTDLRKLLCSQVCSDEWEDMYRFLYDNLDKNPTFKFNDSYENGIVVISEFLYKHSICADPEINAAAMFISLGQIAARA